MSEHAHQTRRESGSPAPARPASRAATTISVDPPPEVAGLHGLRAALNDAAKVRDAVQLRRSLSQAPNAVQLARVTGMVQPASAAGRTVQRLELTDAMWTHIARGELREGNKKLVGYHWTGDASAIAEKSGESKKGPDERGVYVEGVQTRQRYGQGQKRAPIKKSNPSSFWPDAWSEADIKDAIANGGKARNNRSEVGTKATKKEAHGMMLFVNPDSVFPELEEKTEPEGRSGRKGGGRRS